jgi:hypothetical protein
LIQQNLFDATDVVTETLSREMEDRLSRIRLARIDGMDFNAVLRRIACCLDTGRFLGEEDAQFFCNKWNKGLVPVFAVAEEVKLPSGATLVWPGYPGYHKLFVADRLIGKWYYREFQRNERMRTYSYLVFERD